MARGDWKRVSRRRPCPVCEKDDYCGYAGDDSAPSAAICMRIESDKPTKNGGWLHKLRDDGPLWAPRKRTVHIAAKDLQPEASALEITKMAEAASLGTPDETLQRLADELGVSLGSLRRLSVGWLIGRKAWGFPMRSDKGEVVGVRTRYASGAKAAIKGGREGLFVPADLEPGGRLLIAEGPTDTAALLGLGFSAVGRPSCTGGVKHIVGLAKRLAPSEVVIVADADGPGQTGANNLASVLLTYVLAVRVITPPAKDARDWVRSGATAADVEALITATPRKSLKIRVSPSNKEASLCPGG